MNTNEETIPRIAQNGRHLRTCSQRWLIKMDALCGVCPLQRELQPGLHGSVEREGGGKGRHRNESRALKQNQGTGVSAGHGKSIARNIPPLKKRLLIQREGGIFINKHGFFSSCLA